MRFKILSLITLLLFATHVVAQDHQSETWYWGWNNNTHELFAYSENGDSNRLLTDVIDSPENIWRVSENRAIGLFHTSEQWELYSIRATEAEKLVTELDSQIFEPYISRNNDIRLEAYHYPYMVLSTWYALEKEEHRPAFLLNLSTNTFEYLNDSVALGFCCRFTQDGYSIRYVTQTGTYEKPSMTLRERSLDTGIEKVLYTLPSVNVESDKNGDRWLFYAQEKGVSQFHMFDVASGTDKLIYQRDPAEYYVNYHFVGDDLISWQPVCEINCTVQLEMVNGTTFLYSLPDTPGGAGIYFFYRTNYDQLIIGRLYDYWLLSVDTAPKLMGWFYSDGSHSPPTTSPNGRFSVISDTQNYPQTRRMVIDWENLEILLTLTDDPENLFFMTFDIEGFLMNFHNPYKGIMYRYADRKVVKLPESLNGIFFDILPDGSVVYQSLSGINLQIFRYFPESDQTNLLVEGLSNIRAVDVTNYAYP